MKFTDSHCHLDFPELKSELTQELVKCKLSGIQRIIVPTVGPENWQTVLALTSAHQSDITIFPCLGIHPWYLSDLTDKDLVKLQHLVHRHQDNIVAVGETGIDGKIALEHNNMDKQKNFFMFQLELANNVNKPLIVHHRRSHNELIELLKLCPVNRGGIIHAFSGSFQQGKTYIDLGFKLGIGGTITYDRAQKTINAIKRFPVDALVLETDAPAMPLSGKQGEPNKPSNIIPIFDQLADILQYQKDALAAKLEANIEQLFFR